jgi:hypothetical protein
MIRYTYNYIENSRAIVWNWVSSNDKVFYAKKV